MSTESSAVTVSLTKQRFLIALIGLLLLAATWRGAYNTSDNPRLWSDEQLATFVLAEVNPSVDQWKIGDTFTVCSVGTTQCMLGTYANPYSSYSWKKVRDVDTREPPKEPSLWERFINWLTNRSTNTITEMDMVQFLWDQEIVPTGTVTVGPLMPAGEGGTSLSCASCHGANAHNNAKPEKLLGFAGERLAALVKKNDLGKNSTKDLAALDRAEIAQLVSSMAKTREL